MASGGIDLTPGRVLGNTEIVTPDKINDVGQPVLRVQAGAITTRELADGSISSDKLDVDLEAQLGVADGSVTTAKIVDEAVTTDKIEESARIPVGVIMDYAGSAAPAGWLLCYGQAVSRSTYSDLFLAIGITFGAGNGTTTFNLPDCRGRVLAGKDNMGGSAALRLDDAWVSATGIYGTVLGHGGGGCVHQLTEAQMPAHYHMGGLHTHPFNDVTMYIVAGTGVAYGTIYSIGNTTSSNSTGNGGNVNTGFAGQSNYHNNVQPTIILNKIIRY